MPNEIIERVRSGDKICKSGASPDCVEIANPHDFVGRVCDPCSRYLSRAKYIDKKEQLAKEAKEPIVPKKRGRKPKVVVEGLIDAE